MFITRLLFDTIISHTSNKIIVIYGPRQVGKTTLTKLLVDHYNLKTLHISGENVIQHNYFQYEDFEKLSAYIQDYAMIVVDEAQKISNIGMILKLIYDTYPEKKIIVTGSSSLDLANGISESLTGRKLVYHLYPLAMCELDAHLNLMELDQYHKTAMIYGLYPEVYTTVGLESKQQLLKELVNSYLFKDVLALDGIKHSQVLVNLTKLLAYQIGQEVSINELAAQLGVSAETVNRYIYLLEQSFIIYSLRAYSKNGRKEISKKHKYYFYDLGIRNTLISNYDPIEVRADKGALWENFVINERIKRSSYHQHYHNRYFWRTYTGSEVDYIEEYGGGVHGYEFKYQSQKMTSSRAFYTAYPDATLQLINSSNYLRFITSFK